MALRPLGVLPETRDNFRRPSLIFEVAILKLKLLFQETAWTMRFPRDNLERPA